MYVYYVDGIYMGKKKDNPYGIEAVPGVYDGQEMRSQLEIKWAQYLDRHGIPWLYEDDVPGLTGYIPDFKIPIGRGAYTWLECKPNMWDGYPVAPLSWLVKCDRLSKVTGEQVIMVMGEPVRGITYMFWDCTGEEIQGSQREVEDIGDFAVTLRGQ